MYSFTNQFSGPTLRQRVGMINRHRSGASAWGRYTSWVVLMGLMAFACRHKNVGDRIGHATSALPATNPTRALVVALEDKGTWYQHMAVFDTKFGTKTITGDPIVVQSKDNRLVLPDAYKLMSAVYINGKEVSADDLARVSSEFVSELFVMHQFENMANVDRQAKPYQVMVQTRPQPVTFDPKRRQFFTLLQAAALSEHPLGESFMFTMNSLLEATFFHNKQALVERTKNEHLKLYDEFENNVDIFINELPATAADVRTVHVREVARLYTKERPYSDWFRADEPLSRFELHIQTTPKRAKRDSSYYVFSPFYTGDF